MLERTFVPRNNRYDYSSAYKAEDVTDQDLRGHYHDYSLAKRYANKWFEINKLPFITFFKPVEEYEEDSMLSNMELQMGYILPNGKTFKFMQFRLTKNQIRLNCHWNIIARQVLQAWDDTDRKEVILQAAKEIQEVEAAYEAAYA